MQLSKIFKELSSLVPYVKLIYNYTVVEYFIMYKLINYFIH